MKRAERSPQQPVRPRPASDEAAHRRRYAPGWRGRAERAEHRWMAVDISTGGAIPAGRDPTEGVRFPERLAELLYDLFAPGTTIYLTDKPATADTTTAPDFAILTGQAGSP